MKKHPYTLYKVIEHWMSEALKYYNKYSRQWL